MESNKTINETLARAEQFAQVTDTEFAHAFANPLREEPDDSEVVAELNRLSMLSRASTASLRSEKAKIEALEREIELHDDLVSSGRGAGLRIDRGAIEANLERARARARKLQAGLDKVREEVSWLPNTQLDLAVATARGVDVDTLEVEDRPLSMTANFDVRLFGGKKLNVREVRRARLVDAG